MNKFEALFLVGCLCICSVSIGGTYHNSHRPGGIIKPPVRPVYHKCNWCAENALCVDNSYCKCISSLYTGNPYFLCYKHTTHDMCQLCDDPVLTTENKENSSLSYLSNTLMLDKTFSRPAFQGTCRMRVVLSSFRHEGKSYPRCVLVSIDLKGRGYRPTCSFIYKICGYSQSDGTLRWQIFKGIRGKYGRVTLFLWRTISSGATKACPNTICGCPTYFHVSRGKILTLRVTCCSFKLGFRPFIKRSEWLKTGVYVLTCKSKDQNPQLPPSLKDYNICLRRGISLNDLLNKVELSTHRHAMSFLALTNTPTDLITVSSDQIAMRDALLRCSPKELRQFFHDANFMLANHLFINKISRSAKGFVEIIQMVKKAVEWYCEGNDTSCGSVISIIKERAQGLLSRPEKFPKLVQFVARNCTNP